MAIEAPLEQGILVQGLDSCSDALLIEALRLSVHPWGGYSVRRNSESFMAFFLLRLGTNYCVIRPRENTDRVGLWTPERKRSHVRYGLMN